MFPNKWINLWTVVIKIVAREKYLQTGNGLEESLDLGPGPVLPLISFVIHSL
jgi:hypothetical protein